MVKPPFEAPKGFRWKFCAFFWHVRAQKYVYAHDHGRKAWAILVRCK